MAETRIEHADYTLDFLDRTRGTEVLADPQNRKEFIEGLDYDGFRDWLVRINGMARGLNPGERGIDGEHVEVPTLMPPEPEDKEPLLEATLDGAKTILSTGDDVERSLDRVSLLFSGAVNYIHPFEDGNGRTSRILGFLTRDGYDGSEESKARFRAVVGDDGRVQFQNNPSQLTGFLDTYVRRTHKPDGATKWPVRVVADHFADEPLGEEVLKHLSKESQAKAEKLVRDNDYGSTAVTKVMIERDLLPDGVDFSEKNFAWVEPDRLFAKFKDEDIETARKESQAMRKDRVLNFIQAMEDPNSFPIHLSEKDDITRFEERDTTLADYFEENLREYSKLYTEKNPRQRRVEQKAGEVALPSA